MSLVILCAKSDWGKAKDYLERYTHPPATFTGIFGPSEWTAIHYVAAANPPTKDSIELLESLLRQKSQDPNQRTSSGSTPLHLAAWYGAVDAVTTLLSNGASPKATTISSRTPLHFACRQGHREIIRTLIQIGASVNAVDKRGMTPLHFAVEFSDPQCIEILIESGADPSIEDAEGRIPYALGITSEVNGNDTMIQQGRSSPPSTAESITKNQIVYLEQDQKDESPSSSIDSFANSISPDTTPVNELGPEKLAEAISLYISHDLPTAEVARVRSFAHSAIESSKIQGGDLLEESKRPENLVKLLVVGQKDFDEMNPTTRVAVRHGLLAFISEARAAKKIITEENAGWTEAMFRKEVVVAVSAGLLFSIIVPFTRK